MPSGLMYVLCTLIAGVLKEAPSFLGVLKLPPLVSLSCFSGEVSSAGIVQEH